ncbi:hypothetical protein BC826DRAFT_716026 [Russula brevipes]|nr:hypothetical protein BC826DRAFT_716026 [Russula brevipes]
MPTADCRTRAPTKQASSTWDTTSHTHASARHEHEHAHKCPFPATTQPRIHSIDCLQLGLPDSEFHTKKIPSTNSLDREGTGGGGGDQRRRCSMDWRVRPSVWRTSHFGPLNFVRVRFSIVSQRLLQPVANFFWPYDDGASDWPYSPVWEKKSP